MEVGDYFIFPAGMSQNDCCTNTCLAHKRLPGRYFATRKLPSGRIECRRIK